MRGECSSCGDVDVRVEIHHKYYHRRGATGPYPQNHLEQLCKRCHGYADRIRRVMCELIGDLDLADAEQAIGYMRALLAVEYAPAQRVVDAGTHEQAMGLGDHFGLTVDEVIALADEKGMVSIRELMIRSSNPLHRRDIENYERAARGEGLDS